MPRLDKETLRQVMDAIWNERKLQVVDDVVANSYVRHDPAFPGEVRGPAGFKQYVQAMWAPFPDSRVSIDDLFVEGNKVAVRWTFRGTHTGDFMGIPPTGKEVTLPGISLVRIEQDKMAECWDGYDALGLLRQLGALP